jgi:hypothetical protein
MHTHARMRTLQTSDDALYLFAFHTFGWLWTLQFLSALSSATIAGCVSDYYWTLDKRSWY